MMSNLSVLEPIAVTGGTGFIGKHLVRALVSANYRPVVLSSSKEDARLSEFGGQLRSAPVDLGDSNSISETLQRARPATIFHLAGTRGRGDARGALEAWSELNFHATVRLLEASMSAGGRRSVIVGTAEEYGNQPRCLNESQPAQATLPY